ncbi:hypothetical protein ACFYQA_17460 [Streptomyces sp. NPDC005774]|uniref:hypothetical protein n=1 Tax=Streptomyces sp. NPDC005774 TaxID=3364728 RepID=UPI0036BE15D4
MTREERRRILSAAELADARNQAQRALNTVGIPPELIESLRPILAPAAQALAEDTSAQPAAA